jgi:hypothetical protein
MQLCDVTLIVDQSGAIETPLRTIFTNAILSPESVFVNVYGAQEDSARLGIDSWAP